jgi:hypothetical protein
MNHRLGPYSVLNLSPFPFTRIDEILVCPLYENDHGWSSTLMTLLPKVPKVSKVSKAIKEDMKAAFLNVCAISNGRLFVIIYRPGC